MIISKFQNKPIVFTNLWTNITKPSPFAIRYFGRRNQNFNKSVSFEKKLDQTKKQSNQQDFESPQKEKISYKDEDSAYTTETEFRDYGKENQFQQYKFDKMTHEDQERIGIEKVIEQGIKDGASDDEIVKKTLDFKIALKIKFEEKERVDKNVDHTEKKTEEIIVDDKADFDWNFMQKTLEVQKIVDTIPKDKQKKLSLGSDDTAIVQDTPRNNSIKESFKNELINQNIVSPEMIPMLDQMSLQDFEEVFQSSKDKSQLSIDDPTNKKQVSTITDEIRKEVEATVWDSEQDLMLKDKMQNDLTPYDREWNPLTKEEIDDTELENTLADTKKSKSLMPMFKSTEDLVWATGLKAKSDIEAQRLANKFDVPVELTKDLMKEYIFEQKRLEEEKAKVEEHQKLKAHIKKSKEQIRKIKSYEFGDFENDNVLPKHPALEGMDPTLKGLALKRQLKEKYFGFVDVRDMPKNLGMMDANYVPETSEKYNIHWKRMHKRYDSWVDQQFYRGNANILSQTYNKSINIISTMPSNSMTVFNCFWDFCHITYGLKAFHNEKEMIAQITKNLNVYGNKRLAFKLMQELGTKKKMEFRFHFSTNLERMASNQMNTLDDPEKLDFFMAQVNSEYKLMGKNIKNEDPENIVTALEMRSDTYVESYTSAQAEYEALLLKKRDDKKARKVDENGKRIRDNRTPDGKRKKTKKIDKRKEFWKSLGLDSDLVSQGLRDS